MISNFKISEKQGLLYSKKTGDKNKIHLSKMAAYNSHIGKKICHGTLVTIKYLKLTNFFKNFKKLDKYSINIKFNKPFIYNEKIFISKDNSKIFQKNNGLAVVEIEKKSSQNFKKLTKKFYSTNSINNKKDFSSSTIEFILNNLSKYAGTIFPGENCIISEIKINFNKKNNFNNNLKIYSQKINKRFPIIQNQIFFRNFYVEFTTLAPPKLYEKKFAPSELIKSKIKKTKIPILIIGASSGMGLETLKLFKINKKIPITATYYLNKINVEQKNLKSLQLDLNSSLSFTRLIKKLKKFNKLRIYYFATPKISLSTNNSYNKKLFKKFYISIPIKILGLLKKNRYEFFYPSTIYLNKKDKSDYSLIKLEGENQIKKFNKKVSINTLRIEETNTRQNLTLLNKNLPFFVDLLNKDMEYQKKFFFE